MSSFAATGLVEPLQRALHENQYVQPTPIQAQAIPPLLEGRDLLGCARTGTGKTAAFALPILQLLAKQHGRSASGAPRALVLVPTRELAAQVAESFETYGRHLPLSVAVIFGGVGQDPQVRALRRGADVVVATPGRLLDLMQQRHLRLDAVQFLVLDEADHMLDLGFLPDVRRIVHAVPRQRQTLLFSATMPPPIAHLAEGILTHPVKVFVTPAASTIEEIDQRVHFVEHDEKLVLLSRLLAGEGVRRALVFTRTKRGADRVARRLAASGIATQAIHGNKSQNHRERSLESFRSGHTRVLVATDLAARGLDVDDITHVINFELPNVPETYVHRIGRTGRAGASGVAISLCDREERVYLRDIEKLMKRSVRAVGGRHENPEHVPQERSHEPRRESSHAPAPAPVPVEARHGHGHGHGQGHGHGHGHGHAPAHGPVHAPGRAQGFRRRRARFGGRGGNQRSHRP
jgi:ATP-dependent RNA helicase RhlE